MALGVVAAQPPQLRELGLVFDPLGDHVEGERPGHADDRLDDRRPLLLDAERVDELAVDLERVEREAVEVGERGVAGAEVVEDEPHAELAERLQGRLGVGRLLDQDALGDLQPQVDGVEAGAGEDFGDRGGEVAVGDLAGGEVDRDVEGPLVGPLLVPGEDLAAGRLLDPAADRLDQAAFLGDRDELAGVELAALGVVPADQRLEGGDLAAVAGETTGW